MLGRRELRCARLDRRALPLLGLATEHAIKTPMILADFDLVPALAGQAQPRREWRESRAASASVIGRATSKVSFGHVRREAPEH